MTRKICLGAIAGPHGVRGDVNLRSFTAAPEDIAAYGPLTDEAGARSFAFKVVRVARPGVVVARAPEIRSREAAEALAGVRLFVDRAALPDIAEDDEYYVEDLVGLTAVTEAGDMLGQVKAAHNFGAGDILEVTTGEGGALFVPFTRAAVPAVLLREGKVTIARAALEVLEDVSDNDAIPPLDAMRDEDA